MVGTTIGSYRIESEAGAGGMGIVYRAVDVQLKRPVALKVLNAAALTDPDRKRRFIQEAQAASALNHPDIVTIYQIGAEGPIDFIAMEFVAGRSLDHVLAGRPLPLADVVKFGAHIAGALAAAHHAGIVHRDLKPANVMVTEKGGIKLLDFGVAKLVEPTTAETAVTGPMAASTRTGLVIGTLAYMSPEQARGEKVDARSDVYTFGVVLHEMIAGRRPSDGVPALPESAPRDLRRIVARCLQTDRDERFQSIDDVRMAIEDADIAPRAASSSAGPTRGRRLVGVAGAAGLVAAAAALAWGLKPPATPAVTTLHRLTIDAGLSTDPVLSQDGKFVAFASDRAGDGNLDIWVRQVAGGDPVRLTKDPADEIEPTFSNDGSKVAYRSERDGGGVYVTSTLGGDERRIVDRGRRPRWSPEGSQIVYWTGLNTAFLMAKADAPRVFVIAAAGGEPRRLFADFAVASTPIWSADGKRLLFWGMRERTDPPDWWSASDDGTAAVPTGVYPVLLAAGLSPPGGLFTPDVWLPDGRVIFAARHADAGNIWSIQLAGDGHVATDSHLSLSELSIKNGRFSILRRTAVAPVRLTAGTALEGGATVDAAGTLAYAAISNDVDLWSLPIDPATGLVAGPEQRLTPGPAYDVFPSLSPDGRSLVYGSNRSGTFDVWLRNLASGKDSLVAPRYTFPSLPHFTKDGLRITYRAEPGRWLSVPLAAAGTRTTAPQVVCDGCESLWDLSTDGKWTVFGTNGDTRIMARNTSGVTFEMMNYPDQVMGRMRISPDDRWMVFNNREGGTIRIVVVPFQPGTPIPRDRWITLTPEDTMVLAPTWSADGGTLYYLSDRDGSGFCVWGQRIDHATGHAVGEPFGVWHLHEARHSMTRIPMGHRAVTASRDRLVLSVAEASGNIWLAK
jgi:eukaryotic-like serine/threonine-protein kinase